MIYVLILLEGPAEENRTMREIQWISPSPSPPTPTGPSVHRVLVILMLGRMLSSYMLEMTCPVFLMVSTDWSSYTLRLVPLSGWREILSEKQRGPGMSVEVPVLVSR